MPIWEWVKNNIPTYAEEIIINQEVEKIQETLSNFKQLIPNGFVELGRPKKYWGSTEGLDKPLCERYTFKHDGKLTTLDITKELSDELKLNLENNFCVKEEVLSRSLEEGGITINNKEEIFLRKSFTVENLEKDINKLLDKIKELEKELEKEKGWWDKWVNDDNFFCEWFDPEDCQRIQKQLHLIGAFSHDSKEKRIQIREYWGDKVVGDKNYREERKMVKNIYQHYRDK